MSDDKLRGCTKCRRRLPLTEFTQNRALEDDLCLHCKTCSKNTQYRYRTTEEYRQWRIAYYDRPEVKERTRRQSAERYRRNREHRLQQHAARRRSIKGRAKEQLQIGVRAGQIQKPRFCEVCGRDVQLDGHHFDYSLPLEVLWLCRRCHARVHGGMATYNRAAGRKVA